MKTTYVTHPVTQIDWTALARLKVMAGETLDGQVVMSRAHWAVAVKARAVTLGNSASRVGAISPATRSRETGEAA